MLLLDLSKSIEEQETSEEHELYRGNKKIKRKKRKNPPAFDLLRSSVALRSSTRTISHLPSIICLQRMAYILLRIALELELFGLE